MNEQDMIKFNEFIKGKSIREITANPDGMSISVILMDASKITFKGGSSSGCDLLAASICTADDKELVHIELLG